jgi:hypothetical protein
MRNDQFRVRLLGKTQGSKAFFSEEKKQKTFIRLSRLISEAGRQPIGSFLVLFFKKELLPFYSATRAAAAQPDAHRPA